MGRAGTVGERSIGYPDAGAYALGVIFTEIYEELRFKLFFIRLIVTYIKSYIYFRIG